MEPEDFADLKHWKPLPPVNPGIDSTAWDMERIPVCTVDTRKWASSKTTVIVSCSGPAEYWDPHHKGYGYCAYHWTLREHGCLFSTPTVPNPKYTEADRRRDQATVEEYFQKRREQGLPGHYI